jgi:hypothetical protein
MQPCFSPHFAANYFPSRSADGIAREGPVTRPAVLTFFVQCQLQEEITAAARPISAFAGQLEFCSRLAAGRYAYLEQFIALRSRRDNLDCFSVGKFSRAERGDIGDIGASLLLRR